MAFLIPRDPLIPIKLTARVDPTAKVLRAAEYGAVSEAKEFLAAAQKQAEHIISGAHTAFETERQRGYQDGKQEALLNQAEKMIETVSRTIDYFSQVENDMVELVMSAVGKIIDSFNDKQKIIIVVRNALAVVRNQKQMTLRLNVNEVEAVRSQLNELLASYPGVGYLDIIADGRLEPGSCILESEIGMVEASLSGQIAALRTAFQRVLGSRI